MTSQRSSVTGTLAVMGGAFDPVHYGHLRTAVELIERLEFDELRFCLVINVLRLSPSCRSHGFPIAEASFLSKRIRK